MKRTALLISTALAMSAVRACLRPGCGRRHHRPRRGHRPRRALHGDAIEHRPHHHAKRQRDADPVRREGRRGRDAAPRGVVGGPRQRHLAVQPAPGRDLLGRLHLRRQRRQALVRAGDERPAHLRDAALLRRDRPHLQRRRRPYGRHQRRAGAADPAAAALARDDRAVGDAGRVRPRSDRHRPLPARRVEPRPEPHAGAPRRLLGRGAGRREGDLRLPHRPGRRRGDGDAGRGRPRARRSRRSTRPTPTPTSPT